MKKRILFCFLLCALFVCFPQNIEAQKNYPNYAVAYIGYGQHNFLNSTYNNLYRQGYIGSGHTFTGGMRFRFINYLSLESGGFLGSFNVKENTPSWGYQSSSVSTSGIDASLSVLLMSHKIKWIKPYAGAGYQSSNITLREKSTNTSSGSNQSNGNIISKVDTSGPFWRFHLGFAFDFIEFGAEYREVITTSGNANTRYLQFTLNYHLKGLKK